MTSSVEVLKEAPSAQAGLVAYSDAIENGDSVEEAIEAGEEAIRIYEEAGPKGQEGALVVVLDDEGLPIGSGVVECTTVFNGQVVITVSYQPKNPDPEFGVEFDEVEDLKPDQVMLSMI